MLLSVQSCSKLLLYDMRVREQITSKQPEQALHCIITLMQSGMPARPKIQLSVHLSKFLYNGQYMLDGFPFVQEARQGPTSLDSQ